MFSQRREPQVGFVEITVDLLEARFLEFLNVWGRLPQQQPDENDQNQTPNKAVLS
jgi:hypothetical protein